MNHDWWVPAAVFTIIGTAAIACGVVGHFRKRRKQREDEEIEAAMRDGFRRLAQEGELDRMWRIS